MVACYSIKEATTTGITRFKIFVQKWAWLSYFGKNFRKYFATVRKRKLRVIHALVAIAVHCSADYTLHPPLRSRESQLTFLRQWGLGTHYDRLKMKL